MQLPAPGDSYTNARAEILNRAYKAEQMRILLFEFVTQLQTESDSWVLWWKGVSCIRGLSLGTLRR